MYTFIYACLVLANLLGISAADESCPDSSVMLQVRSDNAIRMPWYEGVKDVKAAAERVPLPHTDKFTVHSYQTMYGTLLEPLAQSKPNIKLLEIGLGCDMAYGPGGSVKVWKELFPNADLWEAEYDEKCVNKSQKEGKLQGMSVLVGDQGNSSVLDDWRRISGGSFDAIIDDGGHHNPQIKASFDALWPEVNPGGIYFIEDLQVGRVPKYEPNDASGHAMVMSDIIQSWTDQLLIRDENVLGAPAALVEARQKWPLPDAVDFIFCQKEACAIGKKPSNTSNSNSSNFSNA